jgi:hypothetical protein
MERQRRVVESAGLLIFLFLSFLPPVFSQQQPSGKDQPLALVGRIGQTEGEVLRFVADNDDWIVVAKGALFQSEEVFYTDEKGGAEFIMPNDTTARIGCKTQIQLTKIQNDITEVYIASGVARITNKGPSITIKASTPFGDIITPAETIFDLHAGDESVEVVCIKGKAVFIPPGEAAKYEVIAGGSSLLCEGSEAEGNVLRFVRAGNDWVVTAPQRTDTKAPRFQLQTIL